jgi:lipopolysaccharide export system permease protein
MRLLDRYLLRELFTPLGFCLSGIQTLGVCLAVFNAMQEQDRKLSLIEIMQYATAITPEFLASALPVVLLLAMLYTLANHARYNEITAMRAAGISLWRICAPYFAVGVVASFALFALNEFLVPRSTEWANRILNRHVEKPNAMETQNKISNFGFTNERGHRKWFIAEYHVYTGVMIKPQVSWNLPDGSSWELHADRAVRTNGVWKFFNVAEYSQADADAPLLPFLQTNALVMPDFDETPGQIISEIKISSYQKLSATRKADIPLMEILDYLKLHPNLSRKDSGWLLTKLHGRIAAPWTCLVVVFIAIPFGAASGRRNLFVGVAGSIFICFTFFAVQQVSLALGSSGYLPAWLAAWLPNLIFAATGLALMARVR